MGGGFFLGNVFSCPLKRIFLRFSLFVELARGFARLLPCRVLGCLLVRSFVCFLVSPCSSFVGVAAAPSMCLQPGPDAQVEGNADRGDLFGIVKRPPVGARTSIRREGGTLVSRAAAASVVH